MHVCVLCVFIMLQGVRMHAVVEYQHQPPSYTLLYKQPFLS